jgi:hypothetical protein
MIRRDLCLVYDTMHVYHNAVNRSVDDFAGWRSPVYV